MESISDRNVSFIMVEVIFRMYSMSESLPDTGLIDFKTLTIFRNISFECSIVRTPLFDRTPKIYVKIIKFP